MNGQLDKDMKQKVKQKLTFTMEKKGQKNVWFLFVSDLEMV